jgi:IS66 C-terminal element
MRSRHTRSARPERSRATELRITVSCGQLRLWRALHKRRNWLFAGSEAAAHRTAILCSLVQTCKHLGVDPFTYLRDVIDRVSTHPARRILELTPREWQRLRVERGRTAA